MAFRIFIFFAIFLGYLSSLALAQDQEIKDPVVLFDRYLISSEPTEKKMFALAHLLQRLPTKSKHERDIKELLSKEFYNKFGKTADEVLNPPKRGIETRRS